MFASASSQLEQSRTKPHGPAEVQSTDTQKSDLNCDKQIAQLEQLQKQFEKKTLKTAGDLARGAQNNLDSSEAQLKECGIIDRFSGLQASLEKQVSTDREHAKNTKEHYEKIKEILDKSKQSLAEAKNLIESAGRSERSGNAEEAAELRKRAADLISAASDSLAGTKAINQEHFKKASEGYRESSLLACKASSRLETAENITHGIKEVNHAVGVGVGFALGGSVGAGLVNQGLRMVESGATEITSVVIGSKTADQALDSFGQSSKDAVVESLVTGVAGAAGGKLGKAVGSLSSPLAAKAADIAGTGAVAAGGEAIQIAYEYSEARQQFIKDNPSLKGKDLEAGLDQYLQARNLDLEAISKRLGVSLASGAASKLIGNVLSGKATEGVRQQLAEQAGDLTGNVTEMAANGQEINASGLVTTVLGGAASSKLTNRHRENEDQNPDSDARQDSPIRRSSFNGLSPEEIIQRYPPPIEVPTDAKVKGPRTLDSGADHLDIAFTVPVNSFPGNTFPPSNSNNIKVELYYHNYPDGQHPDNWRINLRLGREGAQFVAVRPQGTEGPLSLSEMQMVPRGPSDPAQVNSAVKAFAEGNATEEQVKMLKTTWKGMEQIFKHKDELLDKGLITQQEAEAVADLMKRGHFLPKEMP